MKVFNGARVNVPYFVVMDVHTQETLVREQWQGQAHHKQLQRLQQLKHTHSVYDVGHSHSHSHGIGGPLYSKKKLTPFQRIWQKFK